MELKTYQREVIEDLKQYLGLLCKLRDYAEAYTRFWEEKGYSVGLDGIRVYQDILPGVPTVCFKVPTGGGKTFLACNAVKPIFDALPNKAHVVVWLVPSDAILAQTMKSLRNPEHPYRQCLNASYGSRVAVYSKQQLLEGENFNMATVREQLSVLVLSYDSFRGRKESLKSKQENSNLLSFAQALGTPAHPLPDTDETALVQVINQLSPLVIVDESHHARSKLSKEMLQNFNPCFVLDLTATPREESNIISYTDAIRLKQENMVKLPVIVYNRNSIEEVIADAKDLRDRLEQEADGQAAEGGMPIRPIVLFQAQPRGKEDNTTFAKIRSKLVAFGIPEQQIAIKTADINELKNEDLMAPGCPIRYIITVNALKEGWDCPYAYILASLANKTSRVEVEQIVGRILRLPGAVKHRSLCLNMAYVLTSSNDFRDTLERIVEGLNHAGFSGRDCRVAATAETPGPKQPELPFAPEGEESVLTGAENGTDDVMNSDPAKVTSRTAETGKANADRMLTGALQQGSEYESKLPETGGEATYIPKDLENMKSSFSVNKEFADDIRELQLPQFYRQAPQSLFTGEFGKVLLNEDHLAEGFTLRGESTRFDWEGTNDSLFSIDLFEKRTGSVPRIIQMNDSDQQYFKQYFTTLPGEQKIKHCKELMRRELNAYNAINSKDLAAYVDEVIEHMTADQLEALEKNPMGVAVRLKDHVGKLLSEYCAKQFKNKLATGQIVCRPSYRLPERISLSKGSSLYAKSLYEAEETANNFETQLIQSITGMPNIRWWHRNLSRTGFALNGNINHYPDFIVKTESGLILVIETKGDHLANENTMQKLQLGQAWQENAGPGYRYFMVFQTKEIEHNSAFSLRDFLPILGEL